MLRKVMGSVMVIAALVLGAILLIGGRPVLPHMLGPGILAIAGILLLVIRKKRAGRTT